MTRLPNQRTTILIVALGLDLALGEPPAAVHPVVWIGRVTTFLERRAPQSAAARLIYGTLAAGCIAGASACTGEIARRAAERLPPPLHILLMSWLLKTTLSVRALLHAAENVRAPLHTGDIPAARSALARLVSRDVASLSPALLAAAAVESVAENASDAVVAPILFFMAGGVPAACAYRALNTLDAMWGYHSDVHEWLGKAPARADDLANLVPARVTGIALVAASFLTRQDVRGAWHTMWRDHHLTASPNAGWPMSAMAGALGVELEKAGHYRLGTPGQPPAPSSIAAAKTLASTAIGLVVGACILGDRWIGSERRRSKGC